MFGSSNKTKEVAKSSTPVPNSNSLNSLVQGTIVEGKIRATNDIRIDGKIKGDLICDAKVIIGPSGTVEGTVKCQNAVIEGSFNGILNVTELLNIRETAKVAGEVSYGKLVVQSGAIISGSYTVGGDTTNGKSSDGKKIINTSGDASNIAGKASEYAKEKVN